MDWAGFGQTCQDLTYRPVLYIYLYIVGACAVSLDAAAELAARACLAEVDLSVTLGLDWPCLGLSVGAEAPPRQEGNFALVMESTASTYDLKPFVWDLLR